MHLDSFIARRYLIGRKRFSFINIISLLATLGITFGVAALIVVMSVFNGFSGLVTGILQDFDPHLKIEKSPRQEGLSTDSVRTIVTRTDHVTGSSEFIERKAMASSGEFKHFIWIKGVNPEAIDEVSNVREKVILGQFNFIYPNAIVLGTALADKLHVLVGDTVTIISPAGMENVLTQFVQPTVLRCPVVGLFASQNKVYDSGYGFMSMEASQRLFRMGKRTTGVELRLTDIDKSNGVKASLEEKIGEGWNISTWFDLHKDLYSVMMIERWSAFILLSVIIAVAVFNILASLTMLVLEKQRDIGILRTLGMTKQRIQRLFLLQGIWIGSVGVSAGLLLGLLICYLQIEFELFKLDAAFIIPALPVDVHLGDIVIVVVVAFSLCVVAAAYPAIRAKNFEIIDAIRWE
ncbi:MAG: hypothetical protein CL946_04985 [Ectothiorhodospiraceae bacterium]|nr:hypothetical protein [Ectothiorhodospiraceae bacterium]